MSILNAFPPPSRKPMTPEVKDIKRLLGELEVMNLTNWETEFVVGLQEKITLYEGAFYLSGAQGDWLNRLAEKYDLSPA